MNFSLYLIKQTNRVHGGILNGGKRFWTIYSIRLPLSRGIKILKQIYQTHAALEPKQLHCSVFTIIYHPFEWNFKKSKANESTRNLMKNLMYTIKLYICSKANTFARLNVHGLLILDAFSVQHYKQKYSVSRGKIHHYNVANEHKKRRTVNNPIKRANKRK